MLSTTAIKARKGEIIQVISNLIANAIYAMRTGGILTITTEDSVCDDKPGVHMTIEDTGVGIFPEHISKVFDAFYTTRESIGTGIGLFIVKQFVEGHQGKMEIVSSIDPDRHGTKVSLLFPAS